MKSDLAEQVMWKVLIAVAVLAITISAQAFSLGRYEQVIKTSDLRAGKHLF